MQRFDEIRCRVSEARALVLGEVLLHLVRPGLDTVKPETRSHFEASFRLGLQGLEHVCVDRQRNRSDGRANARVAAVAATTVPVIARRVIIVTSFLPSCS
jgi:hypothetical protein